MAEKTSFDVLILGGGLAGLTLGLQLKSQLGDRTIAIVDKLVRPLPEATHKVGESSIEVGSHYLDTVLGLRDYLQSEHIEKNGLRFFARDGKKGFASRTEIGPAEFPIVPSYQMDRGKLENDLRALCDERGIKIFEGYRVRKVDLDARRVSAHSSDGTLEIEGTWLVDATGRARLLGKRLKQIRPTVRKGRAAWFRIDGKLDVNALAPLHSDNEQAWHARDVDNNRWQSTNHLMGLGYWVWIIPLATGHTSIGAVVDAEHFDHNAINTLERLTTWFQEHEPELAEAVANYTKLDFLTYKDFSYTSQRFVSSKRWACVGEAAAFVDPLYSTGSDFIALANSLLTQVIKEDLSGSLNEKRIDEANEIFLQIVENMAEIYEGCGTIHCDGSLLAMKLWWDFSYYWAWVGTYFFDGAYAWPLEDQRAAHRIGRRIMQTNLAAQRVFRVWENEKPSNAKEQQRSFIPLPMFPSFLARFHMELPETRTTEQTLAKLARDETALGRILEEVTIRAISDCPNAKDQILAAASTSDAPFEISTTRQQLQHLPRRERRARADEFQMDVDRALGRI